MKKVTSLLLVCVVALSLVISACGTGAGSTTPNSLEISIAPDVESLFQIANSSFAKSHPGVTVYSHVSNDALDAMQKLQSGSSNIAISDLFPDDAGFKAADFSDIILAAIPFVVITSPDVTGVTTLSPAQIASIYAGEITNWYDVGGPKLPITVILRPQTSEIHRAFTRYVLPNPNATPATSALQVTTDKDLVAAVHSTSGAIGYAVGSVDGDSVVLAGAPSTSTPTVNASATSIPTSATPTITPTITNAKAYVVPVAIDDSLPTLANISAGHYKFWGIAHVLSKNLPTAGKGVSNVSLNQDLLNDFGRHACSSIPHGANFSNLPSGVQRYHLPSNIIVQPIPIVTSTSAFLSPSRGSIYTGWVGVCH